MNRLRPFWVRLADGRLETIEAHTAETTDTDLRFRNTPAGGSAGTIVAHYPLAMVDAWGEGTRLEA